MSKAPGTAASYDGSGGWFKIYQVTAVTDGGTTITFPTDGMWHIRYKCMSQWFSDATQFTFKIPSSIAAGDYLLRSEHVTTSSFLHLVCS